MGMKAVGGENFFMKGVRLRPHNGYWLKNNNVRERNI